MSKPKISGLGRGLDAIFVDNTDESPGRVNIMRLADIEPRADQPRKNFDPQALSALADSIAAHGLIQQMCIRDSSKVKRGAKLGYDRVEGMAA